MVSLISRVDTAHRDMIHDAQMDYYGTRLATCSSDRTVKIFDIKPSGQQILLADLQGHEGPVWQVAWSHPMFGNLLASCSYDKRVIVWKDQGGGKWGKVFDSQDRLHDSSVNSIAFAPSEYGLILASASSDGTIGFISSKGDGQWETKKIKSAHSIGCNAVSWCPSITPGSLSEPISQPLCPKRIVTGGCDNLVKIWKESANGDWVEECRLEQHRDWVRDVAWAPTVGLEFSIIASCSQDCRVVIWKCRDLDSQNWQPTILHQFDDVVWHVSWSICGTILAVSCGDNKVTLWKENLEGQWICLTDNKSTQQQQQGTPTNAVDVSRG